MKIGLLTIHNALNYGALFQAYATQEIFSRYGKVEIIDYKNRHIEKHYLPFSISRISLSWKAPLQFAREIYLFKGKLYRSKKFREFWGERLSVSKKKFHPRGGVSGYDLLICGSDQVWNPRITNSCDSINEDYFFSGAPSDVRKISYASSFGSYRYSDKDVSRLKILLDSIGCLSVREQDGAQYIQGVLGREVPVVLDPTLLLTKEEWVNKIGLRENDRKTDYILAYTVPRSSHLKEAVNHYSKLGYKVILVDPALIPIGRAGEQRRDVGPEEFLNLILNAKLILTDSFHGVCFSINFKKNFFAFNSGDSSNRIRNILSLVGLESRLIESTDLLAGMELISDEDYRNAHCTLDKLRDYSFGYIDRSMNGATVSDA